MTGHMKARTSSSTGVRTIRVLVADDHLVYRIGIRNLIGSEPGFEVIGEAADGNQALDLYRKLEAGCAAAGFAHAAQKRN